MASSSVSSVGRHGGIGGRSPLLLSVLVFVGGGSVPRCLGCGSAALGRMYWTRPGRNQEVREPKRFRHEVLAQAASDSRLSLHGSRIKTFTHSRSIPRMSRSSDKDSPRVLNVGQCG